MITFKEGVILTPQGQERAHLKSLFSEMLADGVGSLPLALLERLEKLIPQRPTFDA